MNIKSISLIIFIFITIVNNDVVFAENKSDSKKRTATPVLVQTDEFGQKSIDGWVQPSEICGNCKDAWHDQYGSQVWLEKIDSGDFEEVLDIFAQNNELSNFQVLSKATLKKANLLDSEGYGWTVFASANKNKQQVRLALILIFGSLDESPKMTGIHAYLAREEDFINSGGWVVPASFWLDVDPTKDVGDIVRQGLKNNQVQAKTLSQLSDIWIENIYNQYILQMQVNVRAMHNFRISVIAADDPNAVIIPGDNGYNDIEFKY